MKLKNIIAVIILGLGIFLLFTFFKSALNIEAKIVIIIGFIFICLNYKSLNRMFIGYLIILISILFIRDKVEVRYTTYHYFNTWIKLVFKNKIVFFNVFGNLILYVPFIIYTKIVIRKWYFSLLLTFLVIIFAEFLQFVLAIGVFDPIDIVLNLTGVLIYLGGFIWKTKKYERSLESQV